MPGAGEHGGVLLERDRELERIGRCLERAKAGDGSALMVEGPAGIAPTPKQRDAVHAHVRAVRDALVPWRASHDYYNFGTSPAGADAVLPPASYHRLQEIKARYDPDQVIISTHLVRPARP